MDHHPGADRRERGRRRSPLTLKEQPLRLVDDRQQLVRSDVLDEPWVLPVDGYGGIQAVMKPYSDPGGDTPAHLLGAGIVAHDKVGAEAFHLLVQAIWVGDPHLGTWALALKAEGEDLPVRERRCGDQYTNLSTLELRGRQTTLKVEKTIPEDAGEQQPYTILEQRLA